jgi:hypothetical protein
MAGQQNADVGSPAGVHKCSNLAAGQPKRESDAMPSQRFCYHIRMGWQLCSPLGSSIEFPGKVFFSDLLLLIVGSPVNLTFKQQ